MKHLLNNMTESEKNAIREQHTDKLKVDTSKFFKLVESKLGDVKPILIEAETMDPEPVSSGEELSASFAFDEGQKNFTRKTKDTIKDFLRKSLIKSIPTIKKFIDSNFKLPQMVFINVGTSHTGTPAENAEIARERQRVFRNILIELFREGGLREDRIEQLVQMTQTDYTPSEFNYSFYDPTRVKPDDKERFGTIILRPITTRGLEANNLARSSGRIQASPILKSDTRDFWDKLMDLDFSDRSSYIPNQNEILKGILMLGSYSDVERINQEIVNSKKTTLDYWINRNISDSEIMQQICNHLTKIISSRPGASEYQVNCRGNGIEIRGLKLVR